MNIAPLAEVKARLSAFVKKSREGPVIVTRNGKPVAVLVAVTDADELERLVLAHSPKFQAILGKSRRQIEETGGIPHDTFWRSVASSAHDDKGDVMPQLGEYLETHISDEQREFLRRLTENGFTLPMGQGGVMTIRIKNKAGENCGYINPTVISRKGIFGYRFKPYDHCFLDESPNKLEQFRQTYGNGPKHGWIEHSDAKNGKKRYIVVTDLQLAYKILGL